MLIEVQVSVFGLYFPPASNKPPFHTIISVPVHTVESGTALLGALTLLIELHESESGLYRAPIPIPSVALPHTIILVPVQTAADGPVIFGNP